MRNEGTLQQEDQREALAVRVSGKRCVRWTLDWLRAGKHGAGSGSRTLLKEAQVQLDLDPKSASGAETLRRTLRNLGQVVHGVAELRSPFHFVQL